MSDRKSIVAEVLTEREQQDREWGGSGHDDHHTSHDWIAYITKHVGRCVIHPWHPPTFRRQMIRVAALAVAAVEWIDRRIT